MTTIDQLRVLAEECRADREKVMVPPEVLLALLDVVEKAGPPVELSPTGRPSGRAA